MKKKIKTETYKIHKTTKIKIEVLLLYATVRLKKNGTLNLEKIWRKDLRKKKKKQRNREALKV